MLSDVEVEFLLVYIVLIELESKSFSCHASTGNPPQGPLLPLAGLEDDLAVAEKFSFFGIESNLVDISVDGKEITDLSRVDGIGFVFENNFEEKSAGLLQMVQLLLADLGDNFH